MARLTPEEMDRIAREDVPGVAQTGVRFEEIGDGVVRARLPFREDSIRPGGTVNGPTMMGLADIVSKKFFEALNLELTWKHMISVRTSPSCTRAERLSTCAAPRHLWRSATGRSGARFPSWRGAMPRCTWRARGRRACATSLAAAPCACKAPSRCAGVPRLPGTDIHSGRLAVSSLACV